MLRDLLQQQKIEQYEREIEDAQKEVRDIADVSQSVSDPMNREGIVSNTVREILKERTGATDFDLLNKSETQTQTA